ncbi:hypothetical protein V8F06_012919 [Rhypophila decipiens]
MDHLQMGSIFFQYAMVKIPIFVTTFGYTHHAKQPPPELQKSLLLFLRHERPQIQQTHLSSAVGTWMVLMTGTIAHLILLNQIFHSPKHRRQRRSGTVLRRAHHPFLPGLNHPRHERVLQAPRKPLVAFDMYPGYLNIPEDTAEYSGRGLDIL